MSELYRILKPGGWGIFQIPQDLNREITYEDNTITDKVLTIEQLLNNLH